MFTSGSNLAILLILDCGSVGKEVIFVKYVLLVYCGRRKISAVQKIIARQFERSSMQNN
jgi:hypothetical protein